MKYKVFFDNSNTVSTFKELLPTHVLVYATVVDNPNCFNTAAGRYALDPSTGKVMVIVTNDKNVCDCSH